ncbi:glycoside hydrolase family 5 protein [Colletotrichum truncatum]|uniref:Glycoside hydrolase family 5 protein n=1 Tax=Colletotrichum truncatum TaxID=5467 RepID=A0ACC3YY65_COLTU|nr:glycoside hydrolase family 5 protein [Colletotrichum truncatum]KAF6790913.1 glycoside hydrolase family 5 protein [Colletotrichum truncatum]
MKSNIGFVVLFALLHEASAQQTPYGQCGGIGWTGPTTCVARWTCQKQNDWYSQCLEGAAPPTTLRTTTSSRPPVAPTTTSRILTTTARSSSASAAPTACSGTFTDISAVDYVKAMNPGWNLGNTLDAIPNEGSWNNPPVVEKTFDDVKAAGFKSVRIPVTYSDHFTSGAPNYTVDPAWLQRVSDVVDMATARGLYVLTNVHHDSWNWADVTKATTDEAKKALNDKFYAVWLQIGQKLACKSSLVSLEPINEPPATTAEHGAHLNTLNDIFLKALADSGGFNTRRVVNLVGGSMDGYKTTQWFKAPASIKNPWALQYHYYSPYDLIFSAWGKTIWGSDADKASQKTDLGVVRGNFTDVPLIIGEFDASPLNVEPAARWKWTDHLVRTATELNTAIIIWDNGLDHLDRNARTWRDPTSIGILNSGVKGIKSSLPESTVDAGATTQSSSAFVWNKVGESAKDTTLPWQFNGNTLKGVKTTTGTALSPDKDYSVSSSAITLKASFLSQWLSATAAPGSKANLTLEFSAGATSQIEIIQWDVPRLSASSSKAVAGADLNIPIEYKGLRMPAAVKALKNDGSYLFDDWTTVLGPLQQARITYDGQWRYDGAKVVITQAAVQAVISGGKPTVFTFEFYPRVPGNSVTYTLEP